MLKALSDKIIQRAIIEKSYDKECEEWFIELAGIVGKTKQEVDYAKRETKDPSTKKS